MSGVITGPHFLKFFNDPSALAVGTMVAVLEVGAFGNVSPLLAPWRACLYPDNCKQSPP